MDILVDWLNKRCQRGGDQSCYSPIGYGSGTGRRQKALLRQQRGLSPAALRRERKRGAGHLNETVWLIDWKNPEANDFAIAEEVSIKGENKKRPDIVLYVNGIALGVIELKRSSVSVSEGFMEPR